MGIGLSTGQVAAALLGSEERFEYTLVGDTVNLAPRLPGVGPDPKDAADAARACWAAHP
jgi:class 3 adenylate cyclase